MYTCIEKLKKHVLEHPPHFSDNEIDTVLDALYFNCAEYNQLKNDSINNDFCALYQRMEHLNLQSKDSIIDIVCSLCGEHARIFFAAGVQVGICLLQELS